MAIFISHAHVDRGLAEGLKSLFEGITSGSVVVWHSSETRPAGGIDPGDWRKQIWEKIEKASAIIVLLTPQAAERPWLVWESGFAEGNKKHVIPIVFWHPKAKMHSVFRDRQSYVGDNKDSIADLCGRLIKIEADRAPTDELRAAWGPAISQFLKYVAKEHQESDERTLFHDHFHNHDTSEKMTGKWVAKWTGIREDGTEDVWEADTLRVWTDETRLRMVGDGAKGKPYPMEGVVSSLGQVALSYWSEGDTAICGTVLMRPVGAGIGTRLIGTWQGFTAPDLDSDLRYVRGRVAMRKDLEDGKAAEWVDRVLEKPFDGMH